MRDFFAQTKKNKQYSKNLFLIHSKPSTDHSDDRDKLIDDRDKLTDDRDHLKNVFTKKLRNSVHLKD
jgi:hypothetical protein